MNKFLVLLFISITLLNTNIINAQVRRITGNVIHGESQRPIPGASVTVKGTSIGTISNTNGAFQLDVPAESDTLVISFIGMKSEEVQIDGQSINAILFPDIIGVGEVMVVAYGISTRESYTGSASTIGSENLQHRQNSSLTKSLQGLVSGLQATSGSGQPGENAALRIRGISTFGDASPLIVVDGFPFSGNLNAIPGHDIQSVTVLKDAPATALYGSRAANGVIIITTKKGVDKEPSLTINATYGLSDRAISEYSRVTTPQYYELMWETLRNTRVAQGKTPEVAATEASAGLISYLGGYNAYNVSNGEVVGTDGNINPNALLRWNDDWQKETFRTGQRREISINAHGGNEKTSFYASASILNDKGLINASDFNRYTARLNVESQLKEWINMGMNVSGSLADQNFPVSTGSQFLNPFYFTGHIAPIFPVYQYDQGGILQTDAEGKPLYDFGTGFGRARTFGPNTNPLATTVLDTRMYRQDNGNIRSFIDFTIAPGLLLKLTASGDLYSMSGINHENQQYGPSASFRGRSVRESQRNFSFTANQLLTYTQQFGKHKLSALAGHESNALRQNTLSATRSGFPFPGLIELAAASTAEGSTSWEHNYRIESYLGRIDYSFADKYYLSANYRTDGNSIFHEDTRWGDFWGVGFAWRATKEEFLKDLIWLSNLKLKASYGMQGNDKIGTFYAYQGLYTTGLNNLNYPGLIASRLPTPDLTWEKLESANFGLEMTIFNRLAVNLDYYIRNNNDLLFAKPLPPSTGFSAMDANIAHLQNKGIDLELDAKVISTANFSWNLNVNLSHYRNTIKALPDKHIVSGNKRWEVGRSVYDFWMQEWAGVNPDNGKAQWYKDELVMVDGQVQFNDDGTRKTTGKKLLTEIYSEATSYYAGSAIPDLTGGVINTFRIFDFDLTALFNFGIGGKIYDIEYNRLMHAGGNNGITWHTDILDRWTPENRETNIPALNGNTDVILQSTRMLFDADYLALNYLTVGYSLPTPVINKTKLAGLRVYVTGENLLLFTKRVGIDPQQSFTGTSSSNYPPMRTIAIGLNINL
jgi:TonB-linked SusC/RagA family outer membrane protein